MIFFFFFLGGGGEVLNINHVAWPVFIQKNYFHSEIESKLRQRNDNEHTDNSNEITIELWCFCRNGENIQMIQK